ASCDGRVGARSRPPAASSRGAAEAPGGQLRGADVYLRTPIPDDLFSRRLTHRRRTMWSRRRFLETFSALPLVGGFAGPSAVPASAPAAHKAGSDCFAELGRRPLVSAAGPCTASRG